jgi:methylated-DNA-[protein]-cysteine S-methyltransferase
MISTIHESPVGPLTLHSNGAALTGLEFENPRYALQSSPTGADRILDAARRQLDQYFAGKLHVFDLPLAALGTPFQRRVWAALLNIPYGLTRSYSQQAAAIGNPKAVRAVGLANGRNPISIVVPCHRVIGASGALTGYGGGTDRKRQLLDLEQGQVFARC